MFDVFAKNSLVPLILRFALAIVFMFHGSHMVSQENNWGATWMRENPQPLPAPAQMAVAWGEVAGGIAMALGFLTRVAALGLIAIMAGAVYTVHLKNGFDITKGGSEYNFVIIAICLALVLGGGGGLSVDRIFGLKRRKT